jgi:hypothetical protein
MPRTLSVIRISENHHTDCCGFRHTFWAFKMEKGAFRLIDKCKLIELLRHGRLQCYVKKNPTDNPYSPGKIYDWEFELSFGQYLFTDSYRGFNPYSGVEYIFEKENPIPLWSCDYVGYAYLKFDVEEKAIYGFLKKARGSHLIENSQRFFADYTMSEGDFVYVSNCSGHLTGQLQIEEISHRGDLVCRQVTSGRFSQSTNISPG